MTSANTLIAGRPSDAELDRELLTPLSHRPNLRWWIALGITAMGSALFVAMIIYTVWFGIGLWGNRIPIAWGFGIINFVFWIEIAHAGTFVSAVLLLLEQRWRTSVNRIAEAMTIFAVTLAGIFPLLHLGRPWFAFWVLLYPNHLSLWPNFRSALPWDAVAIFAYGFISLLFWYLGMIPDLASLRDSARTVFARRVYGVFALGWTGSARQVQHYRVAYGLMAGLVTGLVTVTITIISMDFAITALPGWHTTLFPPYFIAAALYSGFGMIVTLVTGMRFVYRLENVITTLHLDVLGKMLLLTGSLTLYSYIAEFFTGWYSADTYERHIYWSAYWTAPGAQMWWLTVAFTLISQLYWFKAIRTHAGVMFVMSLLVNIGMWGDRFAFTVLSLEQDFLPSSWSPYTPTWVDVTLLAGSICFFLMLFLLFAKFVPFVPVAEVKELRRTLEKEETSPAELEQRRREQLVAERMRMAHAGRRAARGRERAPHSLATQPQVERADDPPGDRPIDDRRE